MTAGVLAEPRLRGCRTGCEAGIAAHRIRIRTGRMDSRLRGNNGSCRNHGLVDGIIPAIAGMTVKNAVDVIPAKAGIHGSSDQCSSQARTQNTDAAHRARAVMTPSADGSRLPT